MSYPKRRTPKEFILFILIAVLSAAIDFTVFSALIFFVEINAIICQGISRISGGLFSFALNKSITFKNNGEKARAEFRRFLLLYGVSYILSLGLFTFWSKALPMGIFIAKILSDGMCFLFNFVVMKFYVYKNTKGLLAYTAKFIKGMD